MSVWFLVSFVGVVLSGEDGRQTLFPFGPCKLQGMPFAFQDIDKEELDPGITDSHRCRAPLGDFLPMNKIIDKFFFGNFVRRFVVKFAKLTHGTDIGLLGAFTHPGYGKSLDHSLMPDSFKPPVLVFHDSLLCSVLVNKKGVS